MKNETGRSTDSTRTQEKQMKEFDKKDVVVNDVDGNAVDALSADLADMVATQTDSVEEVQLSLSKKEKELDDSKQADAKESVDVAAADSGLADMIMAESQNVASSGQGGGAASADGGLSSNGKLLAVAGVVTAAGIAVAASDGGGGGGGSKGNTQEFTVSVQSDGVEEGDAGTREMSFTITLDEEPTSEVAFQYVISNGTATAVEDFVAVSDVVVFAKGQKTATILVDVNGDTKFEADETVKITLTGANANGAVEAFGTIFNDDADPSTFIYDLSVNSPTVVEGDNGTTVLRYELSLDRIPTEAVQVGFQTLASGTATADVDFVANSGSVTFAAGQSTAIVDVVVNGDAVLESDETVEVRFTGTNISSSVTAVGTITNDDLDPTVDSYTLKSGTDTATANVFTSGLVFTPAGNDQVNSLDNEDELTGVGVNPTLNLTLGNNNDNGAPVITPTLNNIQTVNVRFDDQVGMALDLQDSPDVESLNITRVNLGGATVGNMQTVVDDISVANSNALAAITLTYINSVLSGTNDVVDVELSNVQSNLFTIGSNVGAPLAGLGAVPTQQLERVNFTVSSDSFLQSLNLLPDGVASTGQILDLLANANFVIGNDTDGDGDILEHNAGLLGIGGLNVINVAGAGDVTLGNVGSMTGFTLAGASHTGDLMVNISNAAGDGTASFTSGSGDDTILSNVGLLGDVATNAGADNVTINGGLLINGPAGQFSSIDTGAGDDSIAVTGNVAGSVFGGASILSGAGDDTVLIGTVPTSPSPANLISNTATLNALRGLGNVGEEAVINTGAGNDNLTLTGTTAGDTGGAADGDNLGSQILLGDGDDNITFDLTNQGAVGTLIGGTIDGGAGNNVMNVIGNTNANVVVSDASDADRVTGIQTLNLTSSQSIDEELFQAIEAVRQGASPAVNDADDDDFDGTTDDVFGELDNAESADYMVDVSEFTGLSTINLRNEAGVINATPEEATNIRIFEGDDVTNTLMNLQGGEAINVATVEAGTGIAGESRTTGGIDGRIAGSTELADDTAADMTLNLSLALGATDQSVDVLVSEVGIAGQLDGDVAINDVGVWTAIPAAADTHKEITDLNLTVDGSTDRTIALGAGDFRNMLSLSSNAVAGTTLSLTGVEATTIAAGSVLADLNITVLTSEGKTITTGSGNDVVNLVADVVDGSATLAAANRDVIDLGAGTNRIIVGNSLRGSGADADEVFDNLKNIQEVELRGNVNTTLDDDAFATGVTDVILGQAATVLGVQGTVTDLDIGVDFDRALNVSMMSGTSLDVDNDSNQNLTVNMGTTGSLADNILTLTDAGTGNVVLNVTVDNVAQSIGAAGTGANNDVIITNLDNTGEIDRIVLLDSMQQSTIAGAAATAAGQVSLTLDAAWAQASDTLTVDASDINDDDLDANGDGDRTDAGSDNAFAPRGDIGFSTGTGPEVGNDINDTQTVRIDASGANYKVNITGSQVVDTIIGSNLADVIDGQAGNDIITGGLGSDSLTGGAGSDTFVYNNVAESDGNTASTDTINDFVTGTDKVQLTITDNANTTFNFGSFASVASSGDGDNSLQGTNTVRVVGDGFYDAGADKLIIDVDGDGDITTTNDYQITSAGEIVASDVNFVLNASGNANNLVVRGGQGADNITTGAGDDVFVMVGNLTNADVDGYVAAGNAAAVGIDANIARVLSYSELTATNGNATEVRGGEVINGGAGNDTAHFFGVVNAALINNGGPLGVENVVIHSDVTMTVEQLLALDTLTFDGNTAHTLTIIDVDANGVEKLLSAAEIQDALSGNYVNEADDANAAGQTVGQTVVLQDAGGNPVVINGVTITIAQSEMLAMGEDDAPLAGNVLTNELDASLVSVKSVDNVDGNVGLNVQGEYGNIVINSNGTYNYALGGGATVADINTLAAGEVVNEQFAYTLQNAGGDESTTAFVNVTITGVNDAAVITNSATAAVGALVEDALTLTTSGDLNHTDIDNNNADDAWFAESGNLAFGSYTANAAGAWSYAVDNAAIQFLDAGATTTDSFTLTTTDGTTQLVTVTLTGAEDQSTVTAGSTISGSVSEDGVLTATGNVNSEDVDVGDADDAWAAVAGAASNGGFGTYSVTGSGAWAYNLNNTAAQALDAGQTTADTFTVTTTDGTTQLITVTITGQEDQSTVTAGSIIAGIATEDAVLSATGNVNSLDADANDADDAWNTAAAAASNGGLGSYSVSATGAWTYNLNNAAVQSLDAGVTTTDSFTLSTTDGTTQLVTVTITGAEDPSSITSSAAQHAGAVVEDAVAVALGDVDANDVDTGDADDAWIAAAGIATGFGSYTVNAGGQWVYNLNNASTAVQALDAGQTTADTFTVSTTDGTTQVVTVTITGAEDQSSITSTAGQAAGALTEDAVSATGDLDSNDVDNGDADDAWNVVAGGASVGGFGTFSVTASGVWTYNVTNAAVQFLDNGVTTQDTFTVSTTDGTNQIVTVTITGTEDAPTIDVAPVFTVNGFSFTASDVDGDALTLVTPVADGSNVVNNGAASAFTATVGAAAVNDLQITDGASNVDLGVSLIEGTAGADAVNQAAAGESVAIYGFAGADTLIGGAFADFIAGGAGIDAMTGGAGADTFGFAHGDSNDGALDTITDWTSADFIDLSVLGVAGYQESGSDANLAAAQASANAVFGGGADDIYVSAFGGNTLVFVDSDADNIYTAGTDLAFQLSGVSEAAVGFNNFIV